MPTVREACTNLACRNSEKHVLKKLAHGKACRLVARASTWWQRWSSRGVEAGAAARTHVHGYFLCRRPCCLIKFTHSWQRSICVTFISQTCTRKINMQISAIFLCWVLNLTLTDNIRLIGSHILAREKVVPYRNSRK